jgi:threonine dehydrogenase-like Zn-dependent dehydrogenase
MNKGLTMKTGQTHMMRYMQPVLERIEAGEIDPSLVISHTLPLARAPIANGHTGNVSKHRVSG